MDHVKQFNFTENSPENFFAIIYGIRRSGKSTVLKKILFDMRERFQNHYVYLFSSTAKVDPEQYTYYPKGCKFSQLENLDDELGEIISQQADKLDVPKEKREKALEENKILIILDDCVNEDSIRRSPSLNNLAVSGRHLNFSVFVLSQSICGSASVPPIIRTNSDFIILATLPRSVKERDLLVEQYLLGSHHCNRITAYKILEKITSVKYRVVIITMFETAARVYQEYVFSYGPFSKDAVPEEFKIGHPSQWHESNESESENENASEYVTSAHAETSDPVESKNDVHGGNKAYNKGSEKTNETNENRLKAFLNLKKSKYMSLLPPALSNESVILRNFCDVSSSGTLGINRAERILNVNNMPMVSSYAATSGQKKRPMVVRKGNKIVINEVEEEKLNRSSKRKKSRR